MGKPLKVVVVGDAHDAALAIATDLENGGFEPVLFLAPGEADLERIAPGCDLVVACADATGVPPAPGPGDGGRGRAIPRSSSAVTRSARTRSSRSSAPGRATASAGGTRCASRPRWSVSGPRGRRRPPAEARPRRTRSTATGRSSRRSPPSPTWPGRTRSGSRAYVSPQLLAMTGFSPGEWLAEPDMWVRRLHPEDRERVLRQFRDACATGGRFASEYRILDREGRVVWWRDEGRVLPGPDGKARFVRGFVLDVTEQRLAEESLRQLRFYDQLTGLPNRVLLLNRLGRALAEAVRTERPLALLILALDRFREITNTLGHHNGDLIVRELAARLGDALGDVGPRGAAARRRVRRAAARRRRELRAAGGRPHPGLAREAVHGAAAAHRGLGQRRDGGGPRARDGGGDAAAPRRLGGPGGAEARAGARASSTRPSASPTTPRASPSSASCAGRSTATSCGCTTSRRWTSRRAPWWGRRRSCAGPTRSAGSCPPGEFIPLAEQTGTGLMRPLTRWVLDRAVAEARAWERAGRRDAGGGERLGPQPPRRPHRGRRRRRPSSPTTSGRSGWSGRGDGERGDGRRRPRRRRAGEPHPPRGVGRRSTTSAPATPRSASCAACPSTS